ncbi:MAG: hypothetical protein ACI9XO_002331 [Paraglaciecola sp.]|jgi:hypothetical protein
MKKTLHLFSNLYQIKFSLIILLLVMKQTLLSLTFCAFTVGLFAQIQVTIDNFPTLNDVLVTNIDNTPTIMPGDSGADKTWDFSTLDGEQMIETTFEDAANGTAADDLPNADLLTNFVGAETYYQLVNNELLILAGKGTDPTGFGVEALVKFTPPIVDRREMSFGDVNSSESNASFAFGSDVIPDTILSTFPIVPDSIRIRINQDRTDVVDAYGSLTIPGGTYDVLREKRTQTRSTRVDILTFFGWTDVTDLIAGIVGVDAGLGEISTVNYLFFSNTEKEIIADISADETGDILNFVTYKWFDVIDNTGNVLAERPTVLAYPNPAASVVNVDFKNLETGNYTLKFYNILGRAVWQNDFYINGKETEVVNLKNFQKGTYLYSIINNNGKTLATKRLIVTK